MTARNLVDLIDTHDPAALEALRQRFPDAQALLRWDKTLGESDAGQGTVDLAPRIALAERGIETLRIRSDAILAALSGRLSRTRRLRTVGAVLAAVSNGGLIASLTKAGGIGPKWVQLLLSIVAFVASLLAIFAEHAAGGPAAGQVSALFENAVTLSTRILEADLRRQRLQAGQTSLQLWEELLASLDEIALLVHGVELKARIL